MPMKFVHFPIQDGYLNHWLVAGPQDFPVSLEFPAGCDDPHQIAESVQNHSLEIAEQPVERGPLTAGVFQVGEFKGSWEYFACGEDHRVDQSAYIANCAYLRSWAFNQVSSKDEKAASLEIITPGSIRVWWNGEFLFQSDLFTGAEPHRFSIPVVIQAGRNPLYIRFENLGFGYSPHYFTARVCQVDSHDAAPNVEVQIPSLIKSIGRRNRLETSFHSLHLDRDIYAWDQQIRLRWPPVSKASQKDEKAYASVRLLNQAGRIYAEAEVDGIPGDQLVLGIAGQYPEGYYDILLMPKTWEFYEKDLRLTHRIPLWNAGRKQFAEVPVGTFESRQREALEYAARQEQASIEREMARMALSKWDQVDEQALQIAIRRVEQGSESSVRDLLGLLGMLARFGREAQFPQSWKTAIAASAVGYRYILRGNESESRQLLLAICQTFAGQLYPEQVFAHAGHNGKDLRQSGEKQVVDWLRQRAAYGFAEWGSEPGFVEILAGLATLIDLAETELVWELASALMDKLMFTIALNSFKGLYGGTSSMVNPLSLKGGTQSAFSAIAYLMWGQGNFTQQLLALVSLACVQNYHMPELFSQIATQTPDELWSKERHTSGDLASGVNLCAYKTPDYLLSSVQCHHPGRRGSGEHVWQATLGPGAIVYTNHPGSSGEGAAHLPGFWRGNGSLPCIAQWKETLLCIYCLPEMGELDFTHAYFPTVAFDEYLLREEWAFARKGQAYLALAAANPLELIQRGPHAYRELRSPGRRNAWVCQMGRAAQDGSFADFQKKIIALPFDYHADGVRLESNRGDRLELHWQGPFFVNQVQQPLSEFPHYENLYTQVAFPCSSMEIRAGADGLRLNLA